MKMDPKIGYSVQGLLAGSGEHISSERQVSGTQRFFLLANFSTSVS
jgi:hypothetical protein